MPESSLSWVVLPSTLLPLLVEMEIPAAAREILRALPNETLLLTSLPDDEEERLMP